MTRKPLNFRGGSSVIYSNKKIHKGGGLRWSGIRYFYGTVRGASLPGRCAKTNSTFIETHLNIPGSGDDLRDLLIRISADEIFENDEFSLSSIKLINKEIKKHLKHSFSDKDDDFHDEVLQSTWVKIWVNAGQCRGQTKKEILGWVKRIAYYIGIDLINDINRVKQISIDDFDTDPDEPTIYIETARNTNIVDEKTYVIRPIEEEVEYRERIQAQLNQLTGQEGKVYLFLLYGFPKKEIACKMGISQPRVSQYIQQIKEKLQIEKEIIYEWK